MNSGRRADAVPEERRPQFRSACWRPSRLLRSIPWAVSFSGAMVLLSTPCWADTPCPIGVFLAAWSILAAVLEVVVGPLTVGSTYFRSEEELARVRAAAARALGNHEPREGVDAIARALTVPNSELSSAAALAARRVLKQLNSDDHSRLASRTVPLLCQSIEDMLPVDVHARASDAYRLSVLDGLAKVGNSRAIPTGQRLCKLEWVSADRQEACGRGLTDTPGAEAAGERERHAAAARRASRPRRVGHSSGRSSRLRTPMATSC